MDRRAEKTFDELFRERKLLSLRLGLRGGEGAGFAGLQARLCAAQRDRWTQSPHPGAFHTAFFLETRYNLPAALRLHTLLGFEGLPRLQVELLRQIGEHKLRVALAKSCHPKAPDSAELRVKLRLPPASALRLSCSAAGAQSFWELMLTSKHDDLGVLQRVLTRCSLAKTLAGNFQASARFAFSYRVAEELDYSFDTVFELPTLMPRLKLLLAGPVAPGTTGRLGVLFDPFKALSECFACLSGRAGGVDWDARLRSSGQVEGAVGLAVTPAVRLVQTVSLNLADLLWQRGTASWGICVDMEL